MAAIRRAVPRGPAPDSEAPGGVLTWTTLVTAIVELVVAAQDRGSGADGVLADEPDVQVTLFALGETVELRQVVRSQLAR